MICWIRRYRNRCFADFIDDEPLDSTGWYWRLEELPEGPEGRYLFHLLATHQFQEGLKNYRDLTYLHRNLDRWQQNVGVYANMLETQTEKLARSMPLVQGSLSEAELEDMIARKLAYDTVADNIEANHDWLALATRSEFAMWDELKALERTPARRADIPEAREAQDKIDLLKGALQWNLERDFKERLWRLRRDLQQTGEALVETQRAWRQIDDTMQDEPQRFAELGERVYSLAPRIEGMKMRVENALSRQQAFLRNIAVDELQAQKERLDVYTIQARFALAAIYDIAASVGEVEE